MTKSFISETNYRSLFHSLPGFHVFIQDDHPFKITDVTNSFLDKTGLQRPAVLGKTLADLFLTEGAALADGLSAVFAASAEADYAPAFLAQVKIKYPADHPFPAETSFSISVSPVLNERRQVISAVLLLEEANGLAADTVEKEEPAAGHYGLTLFDNNSAAVFTLDAEGKFLSGNKALADLLEISMAELLKASLFQFIAATDLQRFLADFQEGTEGLQRQYEVAIISAKGNRLRITLNNNPVAVNGRLKGVYWIAWDVTASTAAAQLLLAEREIFNTIMDHSLDAWISGSPEGMIFRVNPAAIRIFGYTGEELKSLGRSAIIDKRDLDFPLKLKHRNNHKYIKTELTGIRKNGERFPALVSSLVYQNPQGEELSCSFISDLSYLKKTESELQHSKELLQQAEAIAQLGRWEYDLINSKVYWSDEFFRIFGLEPQSFEPSTDRLFMICHPDDREMLRMEFEKCIINKTDYWLQHRALRADGSRCVILTKGKLVLNEAGHPSKLYGFTRDITEQVIAGEILEASEEKYRTVFHQSPVPKWVFDLETLQILEVNAAAVSHYGYSAAEFIGLTLKDLCPGEDCHDFVNPINEIHKPMRHRKKNGELIYVELTGVHVDYSGRTAMIVICNDVTEKLNYQEALITSNIRYGYAMRASFDAIWDWDFAKKTVIRGEGYTRLFGHTADGGFISSIEEWQQHIHPDDLEAVINGISAALLSGEDTWNARYRFRKTDQTYAYVNDRGIIIFDESGKAYRMIGAMQDISRQKQEEQEREKLIDELLRINTDLQQFSYITSHNLKSPLANLISILSIMDISEIRNEETLLLIDGLEKSTKQLNDTLNDLHQILVVKQNTNYNVKELDFAATWQRTQDLISGLISAAGAEIVSEFTAAPVLHFNKVYLESILLNLLSNSLKYRSPERKTRIELKSSQTDEYIILSFRDNGLGIDLKRHGHKIFGLYQRFHTLPGGRGLGLYMISSQLQALGGKIEVESHVNQGTCFTLSFPKGVMGL